jgi:Ca-activated chloride channel homolog
MNRLVCLSLVVVTLAAAAFGQNDNTRRPRVAATPVPPAIQGSSPPTRSSSPPVLQGGVNRRPTPTPTPTDTGDDENEVIRVETNLVTMPVSVLDRDGRYIAGLQQRDFQIFENGVEQKVDFFQSVEQPFTVCLLIDVSPSTQFRIDEIQQAAMTFIDQLRPGDRVMIISFDESVRVLSPPTNDRYRLRNAVGALAFGDGTGLYDAVDYVINQVMNRIEGRKAVVLFTDGVDTTSRRATYQSTVTDTEEVDTMFYTIRYDTSQDTGYNPAPQQRRRQNRRPTFGDILADIISGGTVTMGGGGWGNPGVASPQEYERGRQYLEAISQRSGGRKFEASSNINLNAAFSGIAEELRRQYSIGYYPDKPGVIGERKQIKIRVARPNVVVRAKNTYIVGQGASRVAGR